MLRRLNILSWPIWAKLVVGFCIAVVLPLLLAVLAVQPTLREIGLQNLRSYITENGERERLAITNTLYQARTNLTLFTSDEASNRRLTSVLLRNTPLMSLSPADNINPTTVSAVLRQSLLNPVTSLYTSVRLLDRQGRLVTLATLGTTDPGIAEQDQSQSVAYRAAVNEQMTAGNQDQILTVSLRDDEPVLEITNIIYWRDGRPIGYLIAELNNRRTLYDTLAFNDPTFPAYSFLVTETGVLASPDSTRAQAEASRNAPGAQRALAQQVGVDIYTVDSGEQVVGFYAPIPDTPLRLVAEVPAAYAIAQTQAFFDIRLFVVVLAGVALIAILALFFNQLIAPPLNRLRRVIHSLTHGDYEQPVRDTNRDDEIGLLATEVVQMRDHVHSVVRDLEARVAARTRDIDVTQEISRFAVSQRDPQSLMESVVNLITAQFESIYHAQIFLVDNDRRYAVLRASTGEAGAVLIARGHRLAVGSMSVIGQVTEQGREMLARDTAASPIHRRNEFLPNTQAELAVPLRIGRTIIGALDVQSRERDAFDSDMIRVLQTLADQIAIAIQNTRLYEESLRRLDEIERANRLATQRAWQEYVRDLREPVVTSAAGLPVQADISDLRQQAISTRRIAVGELTERQTIPVAVPVRLRGQSLGAVEWELPAEDFDANKLLLAEELANRLAISLENARLFEESQRATERERLVNSIAAKLTAQTNIDSILQTAVREVGQALRAPEVMIRLRSPQANPNGSSANGNGNGNGHHDNGRD